MDLGKISDYPQEAVGAAMSALRNAGITSLEVQAAVLATIAKESRFVPKSEQSYSGTANARIRSIFGNRVKDLTDDQLNVLKANPIAFFDHIYGNRYGNTNVGDGYKYRGRGLNQITFKANYKAIGDVIGVDLVSNPDLLNTPTIAAKAAAAYFVIFFKIGKSSGKLQEKLGVSDVNEIKDTTTAVKAAIMANAGWETNFETSIVQEGFNKAMDTVQVFKNAVVNTASSVAKKVGDNSGVASLLFFLASQQLVISIVSLS